MDPADSEVEFHFPPLLRTFKSGRVERFVGTAVVPPSLDPTTAVLSKDITIDHAVSARLYLPKLNSDDKIPVLVYFHGGGFCVESAFSPTYHTFLNLLASKARIIIVSVNYRLAPEHKLPIAYDDSWAALRWAVSAQPESWLAEHGDMDRIFISGDSAGANIAHEMAVRASDPTGKIDIEGMILVHPYFGKEAEDAGERTRFGEVWKRISAEDVGDSKHNPMGINGSMAIGACRRVLVCVAAEDFLRERGAAYFAALTGSEEWEGEREFVETEGENHVFHLLKPECEKGVELMDKFVAFINK